MKKFVVLSLLLSVMVLPMLLTSCNKAAVKPIGLQMYSVRQDLDTNLVGTIEQLGKMGYKYAEAFGYDKGKIYGKTVTEFKDLLEKNGIKMISSHVGQAVPDSAHWSQTMAWWDECIAAHKAAGVSYLVQPFMDSIGYMSIAGLKRYCDYFNAIGEKCNAAGIKFGYHNHDKEFTTVEGQVLYDYMLKNTDPSKVFFEMDLWWIYKGGANAIDYFKKNPGRFLLLHVKDEFEVGSSGKIDWKAILEKGPEAGTKYYIVEQEEYQPKTTALDGMRKSLDFLEKADYLK
jgi:sugar phosphate isomerase/epimerase